MRGPRARRIRVMSKVLGVFAAIFGVACTSAVPAPRLAHAPAAEASDAPGVTTTLAAKIDAKEERDVKAGVPSGPEPLPTACAAEGAVKDAKACLPPSEFA